MQPKTKRLVGILVLTLLYPLANPLLVYLPNPMVPDAIIALNMILPVLAGYWFGVWSGVMVGGLGAGLSALLWVNAFDAYAILPHALMGAAAGWFGERRAQTPAAFSILIGHGLNILFYWRMGLMLLDASRIGPILLGLTAEATIDVVAILLLLALLSPRLYCKERL